jgi:hypothetical protein
MAKVTPQYLDKAQALAQARPSFAASVHSAHIDNLGLSKTGEDAVIRNGPQVAHLLGQNEAALNKILILPGREQGPAIDALAANLDSGPSTNEDTDNYISSRTRNGAGTGRYVSNGDGQ